MSDSNSTPNTPSSTPSNPAPTSVFTDGNKTAAPSEASKVDPKGQPAAPVAQKEVAKAQATIENPNASKAQKEAAKKTLKQLSIKVDGEELIEDLPFEIPDDPKAIEWMKRELQMGRMGQKRAQEKSVLEKEVTKLLQDLKTDPFKVLADPAVGVDVKQAVEKFIEQQIENAKKTPEQLELETVKEELRQERERQATEKQAREAAEREALVEKYASEYDNQINTALEANKIPKSPSAIKKVIDYMQLATDMGKEISINDVIPFVSEELMNDHIEHLKALPDEALESFYPKEIYERMRKIAVAKAKKAKENPALKAPTSAPNTGKTSKEEDKKKDDKISFSKYFTRF